MYWREFIALITSAGVWPLGRQAQRKFATSSRWAKADRLRERNLMGSVVAINLLTAE